MADDILKSLFVAIGWKNDDAGQKKVEKSVADYEKSVREAEKRVEAARRAAAATTKQTDEQMAQDDLRAAREALRAAKEVEAAAEKVARAKQKEAKESAEAIALAITKLNLFVDAAISAGQKIGGAIGGAITGMAQLNYVSGRTGASVESIKNLGFAFGQVGGSVGQAVSALESFAKGMRTNEGLAGFVKDLGVDTTKDKALQLLDVVDRLKKEGYQVGSQQAEMLGIDEGTFNLLAKYGDQVRHFYAERKKAAKDFNLDEQEAAKASARLMQGLGSLSATVEVAFTKLLTAAAPRLSKWIDDLRSWIQSHQKEIGEFLEWIAQKIEFVGQKITEFVEGMSGTLQDKEKIKAFEEWKNGLLAIGIAAQRVLDVSEKLANSNLWRVLKALTIDNPLANWPLRLLSSAVGTAEASTGGAHVVPPDDRGFLQKVLPRSMGGRDAPQAGDGSRSWRNNNPGNIKYGPLAQRMGATGADAGGFARFPTYETGRKAQEDLLFNSAGYKDKTIKEAIARWAPAGDANDPTGYAATLAKAAGVEIDAPLASLTPAQRGKLLDAQQAKEGWIPGRTSIATGVQKGGESAAYLSGSIKLDGQSYEYGSGNGKGKNSIPIGTYPITPGTIGPWGQANNALGINNNQIWDKTLGRMRDGIEFHAASNANKLSAGCIAIARERYSQFREHVLDYIKKNGAAYLTVAPDGSASITATPPAKAEEGVKTAQVGVPKPKIVPNMTPGGFDMDALTRPAAPLATGSATNSTSAMSKTLNQTNNYNVDIKDSRGPEAHAKVFKDASAQMGQLHLENAQRAFG